MLVQSPFKFLDAYNQEDKDIFFGRDEEVEQLYELVFQSNLTLVYGQSGTGKTSLVQCGLANRFAVSDWFNVYIRRGEDINRSLLQSLRRYDLSEPETGTLRSRLRQRYRAGAQQIERTEEQPVGEVVQILRRVYKHYMKPIYLIFDQFEELYILGRQEEQAQLYQTIAEITGSEAYCRILIIMREESIAQLYDFEKVVPTLFDKRLRVEFMSRPRAQEVITKTTAQFGIGLGDEHIPAKIIDLVSAGRGRTELTYLQVFLDRLYQEAVRTNKNGIIFDQALVEANGNIDDVLSDFLDAQAKTIQGDLNTRFPEALKTATRKVLNTFVTLEGTKRPQGKTEFRVANIPAEQVDFILEQLEKARILRFENGLHEISHDSLALRIADQRTEEEIALLQVTKLIRDRRQAYDTTRTFLNNSELALVRTNQTVLREEGNLRPEEWQFIKRSRNANLRRRILLGSLVLLVITVLSFSTYYSYRQQLEATRQEDIARENEQKANQLLDSLQTEQQRRDALLYSQRLASGRALMAQSNYLAAITEFETALTINPGGAEADSLLNISRARSGVRARFDLYIQEGDALFAQGEAYFVDARDRYRRALALNYANSRAQSKLDQVEGRLDAAFSNFVSRGDTFFEARGYQAALEAYQQAARIRPEDAYVQERIRGCRERL